MEIRSVAVVARGVVAVVVAAVAVADVVAKVASTARVVSICKVATPFNAIQKTAFFSVAQLYWTSFK